MPVVHVLPVLLLMLSVHLLVVVRARGGETGFKKLIGMTALLRSRGSIGINRILGSAQKLRLRGSYSLPWTGGCISNYPHAGCEDNRQSLQCVLAFQIAAPAARLLSK